MKQAFLIGLLLSSITTVIYSQNLKTQLDKIFESAYDPAKSGASILIAKEGKTIYQNQIGLANVEFNIPINVETKFHIGSITKQFTAAAILLLEEEGKLSINDPISKYLPSIPDDKKVVTIIQLLTHTSGIADYPRVPSIRKQLRNNLSPMQISELAIEEALGFTPGTEYSYSNSGYILLGLIIEAVSQEAYPTFLNNRIFNVLNMSSTSVNNYEAIVKNRAIGYSEDENDQLIHATFHSSPFSAGAIISTAADLNKWIIGLHNGEIINEESQAKMFSNNLLSNGQKTELGLGWEINQIAGLACFEQSGFVPGYKANSVYIPEQQIYVVVLQNNEYGPQTATMINAAALVAQKPYPHPANSSQLSETALKNIFGIYQLENGEQRIISGNEKGLFIKAPKGRSNSLFAKDELSLFYKEGYRQLNFSTTDEGKIDSFVYQNRRFKSKAIKIEDAVPEEKVTLQLDIASLEFFVGTYQFEPFKMEITLEGETLFIQPEGSNKEPMSAIAPNTFVIKEIGAEITFKTLSKKDIEAVILIEGNEMKGRKLGEGLGKK